MWLTRKAAASTSDVTLSLCAFPERTLICTVILPARHSLAEFRLLVLSTKAHTLPVAMRDFTIVYSNGAAIPRVEEMRIAVASVLSLLSDSATLVIYACSSVALPAANLLVPSAAKSPAEVIPLLNNFSQPADLAPCCYFKAIGKCRFSSCNFSHDVLKPGCNKGVDCKRGHSIGAKSITLAPSVATPPPASAPALTAPLPTSPPGTALKLPHADGHSHPSTHRPLKTHRISKLLQS